MSFSVLWRALKLRSWILPGLAFIGLFVVWLVFTPAGLTGKLQAIASAVCEQNPAHALELGGVTLFLCSRCTGMYLGTFVAIAYLFNRKRAMRFPSKGKMVVLAALFFAFAVDGINSTLATFVPQYSLYSPGNTLRFATGIGMGIVIANVLLPLWNQTFWAEGSDQAVLSSWRQLAGLILIETLIGVLALSGKKALYYPVVLLSTGVIPLFLCLVYTLLWLVVLKRESLFRHWKEGILYIEFGALCTLVQIGAFDLLRFTLFRF